MTAPLLELADLTIRYPVGTSGRFGRRRAWTVHAVEGVSLTIHAGEIVALVGESGCGKSSVARTIAGIQQASSGQVRFDGVVLTGLRGRALRPYRRAIQLLHQDPYDALDPRLTVRAIVEEGLRIHRVAPGERGTAVRVALERVGLNPADQILDRYPHQLSGGQRQRVAIASAIALDPRLLVADEPVSMLDVSVRAAVLNLIDTLRRDGLGVLLITHDLASAALLADRIAVMYLGRIVEQGPTAAVLHEPGHPYTRALLSALPSRNPAIRTSVAVVPAELPDAVDPAPGCAFAPRCPIAELRCRESIPELLSVAEAHDVACTSTQASLVDRSPSSRMPW